MEESKTNRSGKGRPSKPEQLEIESRLKDLFKKGTDSYSAANQTGYSINTVKKYYNKFYKEIRDLEGPDFAQTCKDRMVLTCLGIDKQISKFEKIEQELELKSQNGGKQDIHLYKLRISIAKAISDLYIKRMSIANSPTSDDMLETVQKWEYQK